MEFTLAKSKPPRKRYHPHPLPEWAEEILARKAETDAVREIYKSVVHGVSVSDSPADSRYLSLAMREVGEGVVRERKPS